MISTTFLHWAAGFLEGEGSFMLTGVAKSPRVSAGQVQREPLDRLRAAFGGTVVSNKAYGVRGTANFGWRVGPIASVGIMMTLYPLLSPKRQEKIREVLAGWKTQLPASRYRKTCPQGHAFTTRTLADGRVRRECFVCMRLRAPAATARWRAKQKLALG